MRIFDHEAVRIHGTLAVELADGGLALLEVDIDVTGQAQMGTEPIYNDEGGYWPAFGAIRPVGHKYWVTIPNPNPGLLEDDGTMFRLRVPTS